MRFKIITAVYNAADFFPRCAASLAAQNHGDYEVIVIDDASDDGTRDLVQTICRQNRWPCILQPENRGALFNQVHGIRALDCQDEDVLVFVDGDDRLAHPDVLNRLEHYYSLGAELTFGQYEPDPPSRTCTLAAEYPAEIMEKRNFRKVAAMKGGIYWNHLRTFKYKIFKQLTDDDFKDAKGGWYKTATDAALMYPCIELAAPNVTFIPEVLLYYTSNNDLSDWRRWPRQCDRDHEHILARPPKVRS